MDAVGNGLGGRPLAYDDERAILYNYLQRNIYAFSAAKSLTQMLHYRDLMIGQDGKLLGYGSFRKAIADQGELFNNTYLKAEYNNAYNSAIMAHKWETLQSDYLEYSTVGDDRVRPEHQLLDKFTALKTDSVWRRIYPPLQWNCRCTVIPGKFINSQNTMTGVEASKMIKPYVKDTPFDNNVGITKLIFDSKHPYFQNVKGELKNLSFEHYGLQSLEKIRINSLHQYEPTTKQQYLKWWEKQPKKEGNNFVVKDALNQEILLRSGEGNKGKSFEFFKDHILKKETEKRFEYATETINILKKPDEIWNHHDNKNTRVYLKYYEQGTLKLVVNEKLEAITLYQIGDQFKGELDRSRKGVLLYRK